MVLKKGIKNIVNNILKTPNNMMFCGFLAFKLYDTYGFPFDLTKNILKEKNIVMNYNIFFKLINLKKQNINIINTNTGNIKNKLYFELSIIFPFTKFDTNNITYKSKIITLIIKGHSVFLAHPNQRVILITKKTPFYPECGGQIGDIGYFNKENIIYNTKKIGLFHIHYVIFKKKIKVNEFITLKINFEHRYNNSCNHSATHLINYVLYNILSNNIIQKGSIINNKKLRFDFFYNKYISIYDMMNIEKLLNTIIINNISINIKVKTINNIKKKNLIIFKEKYSYIIRIIQIGKSIELCKGTHIKKTGDIGYLSILSQKNISMGIYRIEALTNVISVTYNYKKIINYHSILLITQSSCNNVTFIIKNIKKKKKYLENFILICKCNYLLLNTDIEKFFNKVFIYIKLNKNIIDFQYFYNVIKQIYNKFVLFFFHLNKKKLILYINNQKIKKYNIKKIINKYLLISLNGEFLRYINMSIILYHYYFFIFYIIKTIKILFYKKIK